MEKKIRESQVVALWESTIRGGSLLTTVDARTVNVIYPGRSGGAPGADFQDAVIAIDGNVAKGSIEVHVHATDWRTHGHHRDAAYNGVVLHVVLEDDSRVPTALENGWNIPVVALGPVLPHVVAVADTDACVSPPCRTTPFDIGVNTFITALEQAGEKRFREKVTGFEKELETGSPAQVFYRGIMGALGYTRNTVPFQKLAQKLPLDALGEIARQKGEESGVVPHLEAILLGSAGFLPSQRQTGGNAGYLAPWVETLEDIWRSGGYVPVLSVRDWCLFRLRPANHPVRRVAGMARLLHRYRSVGLSESLLALVERAPPQKTTRFIEEGLMVDADGYWRDHFDFGRNGFSPHLIGEARAVEIALNVLLPLATALSQSAGNAEMAEKCQGLYSELPAGVENAIERHMRLQFGLKSGQVATACRRQGLLHLYKRYCTQGRCGECPVRKF
ncbi:MAG: DUF2851 family protein [Dehalococcoidia bacterium]|nr:DUF2851 family protein [Dehalococcoidia bacterium]